MNNVAKKFLTGIMCAGFAAFCVLPVSAEEEHEYSDIWWERPSVSISYTPGNHTITTKYPQECKRCKKRGERIVTVTEGHDIVFTEIYDEPGVFHYNARCTVCGFNYNK